MNKQPAMTVEEIVELTLKGADAIQWEFAKLTSEISASWLSPITPEEDARLREKVQIMNKISNTVRLHDLKVARLERAAGKKLLKKVS